jgi:hypothetical protein
MKKARFEPFRFSAFVGAYSNAGNGLCSKCGTTAEWMKGKLAYCESCKTEAEAKESGNLKVNPNHVKILIKMYSGAELYEDFSFGGESYILDVFNKDDEKEKIVKFKVRKSLENKGLIEFSRKIPETIHIYKISEKGRRVAERKM